MNREDYFLIAECYVPYGAEAWIRLKDLAQDEANAVGEALEISCGSSPRSLYGLRLTPETKEKENLGVWLVRCREAEEGEKYISSGFASDDKYDIIIMAKRFADLVRGKLNAPEKESLNQAERFEVFDEDTSQSSVFDTTDIQDCWGPETFGDAWNGEFWDYEVEEALYRHKSGHWTLITERTFYEAPCSCGKSAKRLDEKQATAWLVRFRHKIPDGIEKSVEHLFFKPGEPMPPKPNGPQAIPNWSKDKGELTFNGKVIRKVPKPKVAKNVVLILDVFQEECWPERIDDPLPRSEGSLKLHETLKRLNENLEVIRFRADGTGEGIRWEVIAPEAGSTAPTSPPDPNEIPF